MRGVCMTWEALGEPNMRTSEFLFFYNVYFIDWWERLCSTCKFVVFFCARYMSGHASPGRCDLWVHESRCAGVQIQLHSSWSNFLRNSVLVLCCRWAPCGCLCLLKRNEAPINSSLKGGKWSQNAINMQIWWWWGVLNGGMGSLNKHLCVGR